MKLEPLYRIRFTYSESWAVGLEGGWQQFFFHRRVTPRARRRSHPRHGRQSRRRGCAWSPHTAGG